MPLMTATGKLQIFSFRMMATTKAAEIQVNKLRQTTLQSSDLKKRQERRAVVENLLRSRAMF